MSTTTEWNMIEKRLVGGDPTFGAPSVFILLLTPLYGLRAPTLPFSAQSVTSIFKERNQTELVNETFDEGQNDSNTNVITSANNQNLRLSIPVSFKRQTRLEPGDWKFPDEPDYSEPSEATYVVTQNHSASNSSTLIIQWNQSRPGFQMLAQKQSHSGSVIPMNLKGWPISKSGIPTTVKGWDNPELEVPPSGDGQNHLVLSVLAAAGKRNNTSPGILASAEDRIQSGRNTSSYEWNNSGLNDRTSVSSQKILRSGDSTYVERQNLSKPGIHTIAQKQDQTGSNIKTIAKRENYAEQEIPRAVNRQNHSRPGISTPANKKNHSRPSVPISDGKHNHSRLGAAPKNYGDNNIGRVVNFGEYKYVAAVYHSQFQTPRCTGVILTDVSVLTSCTCITEQEYVSYSFPDTLKSLLVVAGNPYLDSDFHESRTVTDVQLHPFCTAEWIGTRADLAVLKINKSFQSWFYKHVEIVPRYGDDSTDRFSWKHELENFMNRRVICDIVTFGYYVNIGGPGFENRKYWFRKSPIMRAIRVIFAVPSHQCNATCPNPNICVYDYYGRETACISGVVDEVGPCGALPGSPLICNGNLWGIYTGPRNCSSSKAAAVPTVISFRKFFLAKHFLSNSAYCSMLSINGIVILVISMVLYNH